MNTHAVLQDVSFTATPLPQEFVERIRAGGLDDYGRPPRAMIAAGGEPVRDGLRRVAPGERIYLCSFQAVHLPSIYAEIGPVFVSDEAGPATVVSHDELPPGYFITTFALRAYDHGNEIIDAMLVEPADAPALIRRWLARPEVSHLHARFSGRGCYACRFDRAE